MQNTKGDLISKGILTWVPLPKKGTKAEKLKKLFTVWARNSFF